MRTKRIALNQICGKLSFNNLEKVNFLNNKQKTKFRSFGCVLFEMVEFKKAFDGENMFVIMKAIMDLELNKNGVFLNGNYSLLNELLQR